MTTLHLTYEQTLTLRCALSARQVELGSIWTAAMSLPEGIRDAYVADSEAGSISLRHLYEQRREVEEVYSQLVGDERPSLYAPEDYEWWVYISDRSPTSTR